MANKSVFKTNQNRGPATDTVNEAGGRSYGLTAKAALAQYAATGCLNGTFYAGADTQLQTVLDLAKSVEAEFVGKVAIYSRRQGFMKDMPALLLAHLAARDIRVFKATFPAVVDNMKMVRNLVQIIRSGVVGRKSLGTAVKTQIQRFLESMTDSDLFRDSIGNDPSVSDIIKMVHPRPGTESRRNLYAYLIGKKFVPDLLPQEAQAFEAFKKDPAGAPPDINFQFLSSIKMSRDQWAQLAGTMSWHTLRMNLNTLKRNGVFDVEGMDVIVADKLKDAKVIRKVKAFPFQLMQAYLNATEVPARVRNALQDALEVATENTPSLPGRVVVAVDVSGSMSSAVTGDRGSATSKATCVQTAALMASAILRRNGDAEVLPFDTSVRRVKLNGRDSIMTNAQKLAINGGGTDCSVALRDLNDRKVKADAVIYVSDNQSWVQAQPGVRMGTSWGQTQAATNTYTEWKKFRARNPNARLVCIDLQPGATTQILDSQEVLNVGGFSDRVFEIVDLFLRGELGGDHFVQVIEKINS